MPTYSRSSSFQSSVAESAITSSNSDDYAPSREMDPIYVTLRTPSNPTSHEGGSSPIPPPTSLPPFAGNPAGSSHESAAGESGSRSSSELLEPPYEFFPPGIKDLDNRQTNSLLSYLNKLHRQISKMKKANKTRDSDLSTVRSQVNATKTQLEETQFYLRYKDPDFDQVIWGRSLLDKTMAILTQMAREEVTKDAVTGKEYLRQDRSNASQLWRQFLQGFSKYPAHQKIPEPEADIDDKARYNVAVQILTSYAKNDTDTDTDDRNNIIYIDGIPVIPKSALAALVGNQPAMKLLTERQSTIRDAGNRFAHSLPPFEVLRDSLGGPNSYLPSHGDSRLGICGIIDFLERLIPPPPSSVPGAATVLPKKSFAAVVASNLPSTASTSLAPPLPTQSRRTSFSKSVSSTSPSPSPSRSVSQLRHTPSPLTPAPIARSNTPSKMPSRGTTTTSRGVSARGGGQTAGGRPLQGGFARGVHPKQQGQPSSSHRRS